MKKHHYWAVLMASSGFNLVLSQILLVYKGQLKNSSADQDILMECDQMMFIFNSSSYSQHHLFYLLVSFI